MRGLLGSDRVAVARDVARSAAERPNVLAVLTHAAVWPDEETLKPLYLDAWSAGEQVGRAAARRRTRASTGKRDGADEPPSVVAARGIDWGGEDWTFDQALTDAVGTGDALAALLADAGVTIRSIAENRLDALAAALTDGLTNGATVRDLAQTIADLLDDPDRADMVAQTETTRAMTAGTLDSYTSLGVEWVGFLSAEDTGVCSRCGENEEQGGIPITDVFANGNPPVHPNCRCTLVPLDGPNG